MLLGIHLVVKTTAIIETQQWKEDLKKKRPLFNTIIIPVYKCTSTADKHHLYGAKCKLVKGTGGLSMIVDKLLFLYSRT